MYFNTSHVTVYRYQYLDMYHQDLFQYISCYCLSSPRFFNLFLIVYFNTSHVTVYRLYPDPVYSKHINFNTSHVTVYPGYIIYYDWNKDHFNASHVTVYRYPALYRSPQLSFQYISCYCLSQSHHVDCFNVNISIHLMLLFINKDLLFLFLTPKFQYISCYCLSWQIQNVRSCISISIHLMLLFILKAV